MCFERDTPILTGPHGLVKILGYSPLPPNTRQYNPITEGDGNGIGSIISWIIGLMGCNSTENYVNILLSALKRICWQSKGSGTNGTRPRNGLKQASPYRNHLDFFLQTTWQIGSGGGP